MREKFKGNDAVMRRASYLRKEKSKRALQRKADKIAVGRNRNMEATKAKTVEMLRRRPGRVEALFRYFDADGNGLIDFDEFKNGLRKCGARLEHDELTYLFGNIDLDGSGGIDNDEFAEFLAYSPVKKNLAQQMKPRDGRRRSSEMLVLGMIHDRKGEFVSAVQAQKDLKQERIRLKTLRKGGLKDFTDNSVARTVIGFAKKLAAFTSRTDQDRKVHAERNLHEEVDYFLERFEQKTEEQQTRWQKKKKKPGPRPGGRR